MVITVRESAERSRFEVLEDDEVVGFAVYHVQDGRVAFPHTEVDPARQNHGLASELVRVALDTARGRGQRVLPYCPFVSAYIGRHPAYVDLVPPADRASFGLLAVPDRES